MGEVRHSTVVNAPREKVFAYVNSYRNVPDYFFGISRFAPATDQTDGVGATFDAAIKIGPKELTSRTECIEWAENEAISLKSTAGRGSAVDWRFGDGEEDGTTALDVVIEYTLPGGLVGRLLGPLMGPFADQAVKHTEKVVRANTEA